MKRIPSELIFGVGLLCMLVGLALQNITLAGGSYRNVLLTALAFTAAADLCLSLLVWRGGWGWRIAALVTMAPTIFIVSDFMRRVLGTF